MSEHREINATPRKELRRRLMDCRVPKSELEWFAKGEVERLQAFIRLDYDSYHPTHPYAVDLLKRYPWLDAEEAGEDRSEKTGG